MSQQTFFRMLFTPDGHQWSKLESFLASSILVKHFARAVSEPVDPNNPTVNNNNNNNNTKIFLSLNYKFLLINLGSICA
jgi:hypothetical protein